MNILYVSAEVSPFSKAGGLADVSGALPTELAAKDEQMCVITPLYSIVDRQQFGIYPTGMRNQIMMGNTRFQYHIYESHREDNSNHRIYFIENTQFFDRSGIYTHANGEGYEDNTWRFLFFQLCIIDLLKRGVFHPQLIHCHDHHTALIPLMIRAMEYPASVLFTIHNFDYRGHFSEGDLSLLPRDIAKKVRQFDHTEWSAMAMGLEFADAVNTVSPTYAEELLTQPGLSYELHEKLNSIQDKFSGILNGADEVYWNPLTDPHLSHHYSVKDLSGKKQNKSELQQYCGFTDNPEIPLVGSIGRLVESKGYPLILSSLEALIDRGVQFVFLGSGSQDIAQGLKRFSEKYPKQVSYHGEFNESLAHLIEAGSDMFMMPSKFEPCGLNQIYSLKYGTIPIVHHTGGLADTVIDWDGKFGTGFVFNTYSAIDFLHAMIRALDTFSDKDTWYKIQMNAMTRDFSWRASAKAYQQLYHQLTMGR
ncbi:MAG: glycogen synthase [Candidatus Marinimicrobia bacterium]|nr:glycogen synthase [Candidatus Neomarinimicrobiota bacterium]